MPIENDLVGAYNLRDLGGIPTPDGPVRPGRFVRSGSCAELTEGDVLRLRLRGLRCVVDLRSVEECEREPDRLAGRRGIRYANEPLFDADLRQGLMRDDDDIPAYVAGYYRTMLRNHAAVRRVFSTFAQAGRRDLVLFHCSAGVDRTGVTSMLLLGLAGASWESILADYLRSFDEPEPVDEVALTSAWDHLVREHGSVEAYLLGCGLTPQELAGVRRRLLA